MRSRTLGLGLTGALVAGVGGMFPTGAQESWRGLQVAPENRCATYESDDYHTPQRVADAVIADHGGIYSPYTGEWFDTKRQTDIEHIVARSEAHDSGLCSASARRKHEFAEDLLNLTLASPSVRRHQKVDKDAAEWMPERNECWFADRVVKVRRKYDLTIDRREADALDDVLSRCSSFEMVIYPMPGSTEATRTPRPAPRRQVTRRVCGPFRNCTSLRRVHPGGVPRGHCAYSRWMDRDEDGWACEG